MDSLRKEIFENGEALRGIRKVIALRIRQDMWVGFGKTLHTLDLPAADRWSSDTIKACLDEHPTKPKRKKVSSKRRVPRAEKRRAEPESIVWEEIRALFATRREIPASDTCTTIGLDAEDATARRSRRIPTAWPRRRVSNSA